jgi:hypothetical protein
VDKKISRRADKMCFGWATLARPQSTLSAVDLFASPARIPNPPEKL